MNPWHGVRAAVELDVVFGVADLGRPGRDDRVLVQDGRGRLLRRQAAGVQLVRVQLHHHLPLLAAVGLGDAGALDGAELLDDEVLGVVEDLLLGQRVAGDGDLHDGDAGGAVLDDVRRRDAGRHDLEQRLAGGRHLGLAVRDLAPG